MGKFETLFRSLLSTKVKNCHELASNVYHEFSTKVKDCALLQRFNEYHNISTKSKGLNVPKRNRHTPFMVPKKN
jgi:hypothetical protein